MKNKAFTLIELLVVIAILGILSGIILTALGGARQRAEIARGQIFSGSLKSGLGDAIVSWWSFDEGTGTVARDPWGGNDTTILYGTTWVQGIVRNALDFPGGGTVVSVPDNPSLDLSGALTIEAWVWARSFPFSTNEIVEKSSTCSTDNYRFSISFNGRLVFGLTGGGICTITSSFPKMISLNRWHHVAVSYDSTDGKAKYYIDGKLVAIGFHGATLGEGINNEPLEIGNGFDGIIDEIVIYNRAIPTAQIQKHYAEGLEKRKNLVLSKY